MSVALDSALMALAWSAPSLALFALFWVTRVMTLAEAGWLGLGVVLTAFGLISAARWWVCG